MAKLLGIILVVAGVVEILYPFINTYYMHNPFSILLGIVLVGVGSLLAF